MRGMGGVSDQKQIAVAPASRAHGGKPDPAAVVGQQRLSLERRRNDLHAELLAPLTQDGKQPLPADGGEPVPARRKYLAAEVHVDVVPDREVLREPLVEGRVGVLDATERLVGKDNPEPKRIVGGVALPYLDLVPGVQQLDQRRQVQPCRPAADDRDPECRRRDRQLPSRSRNRWSLPVAVRGSSLANSMARGYL